MNTIRLIAPLLAWGGAVCLPLAISSLKPTNKKVPMMPNHETSRVTLELTPEQARHLQESIVWSKNATEKAIEARPHDPRPRAKWGALDDIAAQLEETKREEWYGNESDHGSLLA